MHRVFCNILQFNLVYLSNNANALANLKITKVSNAGYHGVNLIVFSVLYFNKYPVVGRK